MRCGMAAMAGLAGVVLAGCAAPPIPLATGPSELVPTDRGNVIVVDRGWHTDIAVPVEALSGPLAHIAQGFPGARFLLFGFGDRLFYLSRKESFLQTATAMFPGPGVVLVTALKTSPAQAFGADHTVALPVSCDEFDTITAFLARTLATKADGSPQALGAGPYPGSAFYASDETYDLFHDCNRWTLAALLSAGLPAEPAGVIFAGQVMVQARAIARQQRFDALPAAACRRRG